MPMVVIWMFPIDPGNGMNGIKWWTCNSRNAPSVKEITYIVAICINKPKYCMYLEMLILIFHITFSHTEVSNKCSQNVCMVLFPLLCEKGGLMEK